MHLPEVTLMLAFHPPEVILSGWKMPLSPNFRSDANRCHATGLTVCKNAELHTERRFRVLGCVKTRNRTPCALASSGSHPERLENAAQSELPFGCVC